MSAQTVAALGLCIPFGCITFVLGMMLARWQIKSKPEQVGLRYADDQQQDEHRLRWIIERRSALQRQDDELGLDQFKVAERIAARALAQKP